MRALEICLVGFAVLAILCLFFGRLRGTSRWIPVLGLVVLLLHAVLEGMHWQMIPCYVAVLALCLTAFGRLERSRTTRRVFAWTSLLLVCSTVVLSFLLPMFQLPKPTGSYPVGTRILYLKDSSRVDDASPDRNAPRELMVQVWFPAEPSTLPLARYREPQETHGVSSYQSLILTHSRKDAPLAAAGAPFPVILYNHGWGGRRTGATYLTEELASHGYVVISIDHTYNAGRVAFPDGRIVQGIAAPEIGYPEVSTVERVHDIWNHELQKSTADEKFVLDQFEALNATPGSPWYGKLNTNLVGALGHSFGGSAATEFADEDPRVHGSINLDGWFFDAIRHRGANQPLLAMRTERNPKAGDQSVSARLNRQDIVDMHESFERYGGNLLTMVVVKHNDFTDEPLVSPLRQLSHSGKVPEERIHTIVRTYVLAFFDKTLRGQDPEILKLTSAPYAEVSSEIWPAAKTDVASVPVEKAKLATKEVRSAR